MHLCNIFPPWMVWKKKVIYGVRFSKKEKKEKGKKEEVICGVQWVSPLPGKLGPAGL